MRLRSFHLSLAVGGFFWPGLLVLTSLHFSIGFTVLCQKNPRAGLLDVYWAPLGHQYSNCLLLWPQIWCQRDCVYVCMCTSVCVCICVHLCVHVHIFVCTSLCVHLRTSVCAHAHLCAHMCACACAAAVVNSGSCHRTVFSFMSCDFYASSKRSFSIIFTSL